MPIIRAAAVDAVRPGLRLTLNVASSPAVPPRRANGAPITATTGRTSREKIAASATNRSRKPSTSAISRCATGMPCFMKP